MDEVPSSGLDVTLADNGTGDGIRFTSYWVCKVADTSSSFKHMVEAAVSSASGTLSLRGAGFLESQSPRGGVDQGLIFIDDRNGLALLFVNLPSQGERNCYVAQKGETPTLPPSTRWTPYRQLLIEEPWGCAQEKMERALKQIQEGDLQDVPDWVSIVCEIGTNYSLITERCKPA
ncbi:hypothetical protein ACFFGH_02255 [Lysobacter korlensis]|uniref:Uncharacterized protein n=1 Tax=Lysobacter korlensis TaxID=553636 RepID=A0ABV6RI71_9GAMM